MREPNTDLAIAYAIALLSHYGFELRGYTAKELVDLWLKHYSAHWVRLGVIEALYQGRYKAISVDQILAVWARRGQPIYRFTHEFERLISRKLPQSLTAPLDGLSTESSQEPSLPPLPSSFPDPFDESAMPEAIGHDPAPPDRQDIPPLAAMPKEEAIDETPANSDELDPEMFSNRGSSATYNANWSRCEGNKPPIHQFTPPPDSSDFYLKLKTVVQQQEEPLANLVSPVINEGEAEKSRSGLDKSSH